MDAGEDERGREVRARLLSLASVGLVLAPAAHAQAPQTGRLLVTVAPGAAAPRARVTAAALAATGDARPAGFSVPQIGLVTLRPRRGAGLHALAVRLRADPRVARVEVEHRGRPRLEPNDPALVTPETAIGTAPNTPVEWWAARSNFPAAWDVSTGAGATVAVIDTGAETSHPELADRVLGAASFDADGTPATTDSVGHGTHVASLACGAGNNGVGLAGAGLRCRMLILKSDFSDSSVAKAIVYAVDHGADAINMSFGTDPGVAPSQAVRDAVDYAFARNVVMAAAAADTPIADQGYPADLLQPTGTGPDLSVDKGLSVTAADASDARASFAGQGSQISVAAYGSYDSSPAASGPPGIFGAFTAGPNDLETGSIGLPPHPPCTCRTTFAGDSRYAYVQGTSMATPMVSATAALIRHLNPDLTAAEIVRLIKETARRPAGVWTGDLGWGILDAGAALTRAASIDRRAPASRVKRLPALTSKPTITVRWSAADKAPAGVRASGITRFELWRATDGGRFKRLLSTTRTSRQVTLRRGGRYRFYTVAIDHAGNREPAPKQADARVQRRR
ncbi:MAG: S8 family peptidase [Solirubrobacteraceae bacterium]